jgi:hypothetical protein
LFRLLLVIRQTPLLGTSTRSSPWIKQTNLWNECVFSIHVQLFSDDTKLPAKPPTIESYPERVHNPSLVAKIDEIRNANQCAKPGHKWCFVAHEVDADDPDIATEIRHIQLKGGKDAIWAQAVVSSSRYGERMRTDIRPDRCRA